MDTGSGPLGDFPVFRPEIQRPKFDQFTTDANGRYIMWPLPIMILVGGRFRHGRRQAGISQRTLATRAGVSQSVVSRFERGLVSHMSAERIIRLAMALGPGFPFGFCPHLHNCAWPYDPRSVSLRDLLAP